MLKLITKCYFYWKINIKNQSTSRRFHYSEKKYYFYFYLIIYKTFTIINEKIESRKNYFFYILYVSYFLIIQIVFYIFVDPQRDSF